MSIFLASPTYGPVMPEVYDSTIRAVMFAGHKFEWGGTASTEREGWETARNAPVDGLRDRTDVEGVIWLDSDMVVPSYAFARLLGHGQDLVSALYFQRRPPYKPNAYGWNPKVKAFHPLAEYPPDSLIKIGGFGFGCCYTSMRLIRMLPIDPFKQKDLSEDLTFCRASIEVGVQPYLDTGILCDHYIGPRWANEESFKRWKKALFQGHKLIGGQDGCVHDGGEENLCGVHQVSSERA